ncbi:uncharacterized protein LOC143526760 isoform X2 [Brachyhypopomus gauderio]|uniref:uncharacterized protein LOC143526760 isoform X2 n=1 Tax=Brachyhypopomus gauderio TaxID=698409 RepID=UPI0040438E70
MVGPKRAVSSIQLPSKDIWINKDDEHKQGNLRKAKSLEVLSPGPQSSGPCEQSTLQVVMESLVKEKMEFSAFLDEITRQVISPSTLSSFGVETTTMRVALRVPREDRKQHAKTDTQQQECVRVAAEQQSSVSVSMQRRKMATESKHGRHKGGHGSGHNQSELQTGGEHKSWTLSAWTSGEETQSDKLSSGTWTSSERSHKHPGLVRCYKRPDRPQQSVSHVDRAESLKQDSEQLHQNLLQTVACIENMEAELQRTEAELNALKEKLQCSCTSCQQTNGGLEERLQFVVDRVISERKDHLHKILELTKPLDLMKHHHFTGKCQCEHRGSLLD